MEQDMKRSWIKRRRNRPRPGRVRGKAMEELRRACFERDGYRCQAMRTFVMPWGQSFQLRCLRHVEWDGPNAGHMAHKRNKRMWGDSLNQVQTECGECHNEYHQFGPSRTKPCPRKPPVAVEEAIECRSREF